jgi:hypothetical protein
MSYPFTVVVERRYKVKKGKKNYINKLVGKSVTKKEAPLSFQWRL